MRIRSIIKNPAKLNADDTAQIIKTNELSTYNNIYNSIIPSSLRYNLDNYFSRIAVIEGNSEVENQLVVNGDFSNGTANWSANGGTLSVSNNIGTFTPSQQYGNLTTDIITMTSGHKYLISCYVQLSNGTSGVVVRLGSDTSQNASVGANINKQLIYFLATATQNNRIQIVDARTSGWGTIQASEMQCVDLTQRYPFDTPTSLTDNRVQNIIRQGYKPHNTGSINNSVISEIEARGFNIFDKDYVKTSAGNYILNDNGVQVSDSTSSYFEEYIDVVPNTTYYANNNVSNGGVQRIYFYDSNKNWISRTSVLSDTIHEYTTPNNCEFIRIQYSQSTFNANNLCINRSSSLNGTYLPHKPSQYLPNEYQEVEYLESHGTEYIDSGVSGTNTNLKLEIDFNIDFSTGTQAIFGSRTSTSSANFSAIVVSGTMYVDNRNNSQTTYRTTYVGTTGKYKIINGAKERKIYKGDVLVASNTTTQSTSFSISNIYIGQINTTETITGYVGKIYSCKLYDNGTLVRNFIPCYRKSDNVAGLYDLVNNKFYTNSGTGTFSVGKAVYNNTIIKLPAPMELAGVNNAHNTFEVTNENYVFTRNFWEFDMGSVSWISTGTANVFRYAPSDIKTVGSSGVNNILSSKYTALPPAYSSTFGSKENKTVFMSLDGDGSSKNVYAKDTTYNDTTSFKNGNVGNKLLYQLSSPQVINIPRKHLGWVKLKNLAWAYDTTSGNSFKAQVPNKLFVESSDYASRIKGLFTAQYMMNNNVSFDAFNDRTMMNYGANVFIKDTQYNGDTTAFKNHFTDDDILFFITENEVEDFLNEASCQAGGEINGQCARVPNAYQEVEYIESSGGNGQMIDTGIAGNLSNLSIEINYEWNSLPTSGGYRTLFGNYVDEDTSTTRIVQYEQGITYANLNTKASYPASYIGTRSLHTLYKEELKNGYYYVNGVSSFINTTQGTANSRNIALFNRSVESPIGGAEIKLYSFKMWQNGTLVRNFIPCYRKSDQVIGLYDTITGQFFTNQGTGTFLKGGNVDSPTCEVLPNVTTGTNIVSF